MSEPADADLEAEARALLGAVRDPAPASEEVRSRARARLLSAMPLVTPVPRPPPEAPSLPRGLLAARVPAWSLLASFVVGGAVGVGVTTRRSEPAAHGTTGSAAVSIPLPPAFSTESPAEPPRTAPVVSQTPPASSTSVASPAPPAPRGSGGGASLSGDAALEAERALLDVARTAVGRSDGASALRAAEEHARKFPRGALAEEREAMIVQALRLLHRDDEARARLDRFRSRYPTSLLRPALEAEDGGR